MKIGQKKYISIWNTYMINQGKKIITYIVEIYPDVDIFIYVPLDKFYF